VQPAAGDNGLAIGCAYYGWLHVLGRDRVMANGTVRFGASYSVERTRSAVADAGERGCRQ
jgi:carbamoyltransferase